MKKIVNSLGSLIILILLPALVSAQDYGWPEPGPNSKPGARWWWMGSAVDEAGLRYNIGEYASKGIGALEVTPIYGVKGEDHREVPHLSERWMELWSYTNKVAREEGIQVDMNTGTGWPFGGPHVSLENAACKVIFQEYNLPAGGRLDEVIQVRDEKQKPVATLVKVMAFSDKGDKLDLTSEVVDGKLTKKLAKRDWKIIAVFEGRTLQKVKRAAPGGEGYVMNHFSRSDVNSYLERFTEAFEKTGSPYPASFFNDSYEVYGADWTPGFFEEFEIRRGYRLEEYLPEFIDPLRNDVTSRIVADYRQTLGELLLENFTELWTGWAHSHGSKTRNQGHGSPANLMDIYSAVDIPECEIFGISDFGIKGLRTDSMTRENDSDLSMLKYASSAAHINGRNLVSCETFTWLTEHFRTSLSQMKPDLDQLFTAGINNVYFHGTTYSPPDEQWPGWKFYASVDMSPTNSIWRDSHALNSYIQRCQSFLQWGEPDAEFLLYFPVWDMWYEQPGRLLIFDIHKMDKRAPAFIEAVTKISQAGYDADYISDRYLLGTTYEDGMLKTSAGIPYKAIVVPGANIMPVATLRHILNLAQQGATVIFLDRLPSDVNGFNGFAERKDELETLLEKVNVNISSSATQAFHYGEGKVITGPNDPKTLELSGIRPERMKTIQGLSFTRRSNDDGKHYFIAALHGKDTRGWIELNTPAESAVIYDPLTSRYGLATSRKNSSGNIEVYLDIRSGETVIVRTFDSVKPDRERWGYYDYDDSQAIVLKEWKVSFPESIPEVKSLFEPDCLKSWTEFGNDTLKINMGTALYSTIVNLPQGGIEAWEIDLGDVRESARVKINGEEIALLWSVPYRAVMKDILLPGENHIEIEVTNLPANRIADYDRRGVQWRKFKEVNFVNRWYKQENYGEWHPVPSGLLGPVVLRQVNVSEIK